MKGKFGVGRGTEARAEASDLVKVGESTVGGEKPRTG